MCISEFGSALRGQKRALDVLEWVGVRGSCELFLLVPFLQAPRSPPLSGVWCSKGSHITSKPPEADSFLLGPMCILPGCHRPYSLQVSAMRLINLSTSSHPGFSFCKFHGDPLRSNKASCRFSLKTIGHALHKPLTANKHWGTSAARGKV